MSEHDEHADVLIERISEVLRAPEPTAPRFTERVMASARADGRSHIAKQDQHTTARGWWRRRRTLQLSVSPIGALAIAAGIAMIAVVTEIVARRNGAADRSTVARASAVPDTVHLVRFVFMAPEASSVAMVGDFNNWDRSVTPMRRTGAPGTWTATVPLPRGPHQYAFVIDGSAWTPDPASTTTVSDDFGTQTSVIAVGGTS